MFDSEKIQRVATAAVGAIILTTISVGAAVGPARSAETTPVFVLAQDTIHNASHADA